MGTDSRRSDGTGTGNAAPAPAPTDTAAPAYTKSALYSAIYTPRPAAPTSAASGASGAQQTAAAGTGEKSASTAVAPAPAWSAALRFAPRARAAPGSAGSSGAASAAGAGSIARSRSIPSSLAVRPASGAAASSAVSAASSSNATTSIPASASTPAFAPASVTRNAGPARASTSFPPARASKPIAAPTRRNVLGMDDDDDDDDRMPTPARSGAGSMNKPAHTIKMPRPNAPAQRSKTGTGHDPAPFSLNASMPPPISSVHGRPAAKRQQVPEPSAGTGERSGTHKAGVPDARKMEYLKRPRPRPAFEPPPTTLPEQEITADKELARRAAERRGEGPGPGGRGLENEEEDEGESRKRKWKKKRRRLDAPTLNMDADYDPRLPNDYAAFRALLRERRQAERDLAQERGLDEEEDWASDDDDHGGEDEYERRHEEETRRRMMRFAPPSSYGNAGRDNAAGPGPHQQQQPTMTYAQRAGLEPPPERTSNQGHAFDSDMNTTHDAGPSAGPSRGWSPLPQNASGNSERKSPPRGFVPAPRADEPRATALNVSEATERARRIAQALSAAATAAHHGSDRPAESALQGSREVPGPPPQAPPAPGPPPAATHIHPSRLAQMQAQESVAPVPPVESGPPPPPAWQPPPSGYGGWTTEQGYGHGVQPPYPQPGGPVGFSQLGAADRPGAVHERPPPPPPPPLPPQQLHPDPAPAQQDRPAWSANKTGVVARLMAQMGHKDGEGIGAEGNKGMLQPLRVEQQQRTKAAGGTSRAGASAEAGSSGSAGKFGKRGTIVGAAKAEAEAERFGAPSEVVLLENMVDFYGLDDGLGDEIREECTKFGRVARVFIYPHQTAADDELAVRVFVAFEGPAGAWQAVRELDGRLFGGRTVRARYYPRMQFQRGEYLDLL